MIERTVSSWAWPGFLAGVVSVGFWYAYEYFGSQVWLLVIAMAVVILVSVAIANLVAYIRERGTADMEARQSALTRSADATLMAEARQLASQSPELAAEIARRIGRPDLILFPSQQGRRAQVKLAGSDVTLQFALDALSRSDDVYFVAQRNYQDGTFIFDTNRDLPDRQQWMQLNWLLSREGMVQRYVPGVTTNTAPMWLPPWTPQRVLDNWLLPADLVEILKSRLTGDD